MNIAWASFSPGPAMVGGIVIGLAVAMFLLVNGRIAGISGILAGVLSPGKDFPWRAAFVLGMLTAPVLWAIAGPLPAIHITADWPTLAIAGLLVGMGTRYASGCTSGHGVCGLSRLSPRSLIATLAFMGAGFITVFLLRHILGIGA